MKASEALRRGFEMVTPVVMSRISFGGLYACAMGMIDVGASFASKEECWHYFGTILHAEYIWPWLSKVVGNEFWSPGQKVVKFWDNQTSIPFRDRMEYLVTMLECYESRLPYSEIERCVPGDTPQVAEAPISPVVEVPEMVPADADEIDALIESAEEQVVVC